MFRDPLVLDVLFLLHIGKGLIYVVSLSVVIHPKPQEVYLCKNDDDDDEDDDDGDDGDDEQGDDNDDDDDDEDGDDNDDDDEYEDDNDDEEEGSQRQVQDGGLVIIGWNLGGVSGRG